MDIGGLLKKKKKNISQWNDKKERKKKEANSHDPEEGKTDAQRRFSEEGGWGDALAMQPNLLFPYNLPPKKHTEKKK